MMTSVKRKEDGMTEQERREAEYRSIMKLAQGEKPEKEAEEEKKPVKKPAKRQTKGAKK